MTATERAIESAVQLYAAIAGKPPDGPDAVPRLAQMLAREAVLAPARRVPLALPESLDERRAVYRELRDRRRSYPLSPSAPERYLYPTRVPADSIAALLNDPAGWLRGQFGPLRIEASFVDQTNEEGFARSSWTVLLSSLDGRQYLITHAFGREHDSLELPATAPAPDRIAAVFARLADELAAAPDSVLETKYSSEPQWLVPLLDALVPEPAADSVWCWLAERWPELVNGALAPDGGRGIEHVRVRFEGFTIDRSLAKLGAVEATEYIELVDARGNVVDATEVNFRAAPRGRDLLAPMRHPEAVARAGERYRAASPTSPPTDHMDLMFSGLDPGYLRLIAQLAAHGEPVTPICEPSVSEASIAAGAAQLRDVPPDELAMALEQLGVAPPQWALAFGDYRIFLCANEDLETPHGPIVLADTRRMPPIVVLTEISIDPPFPVDGSSTHLNAFLTWLTRTLERTERRAVVEWLRTTTGERNVVHELYPPDRGEARPWRFVLSVPWMPLDEAMLAGHEHEVAVYHGFLRAAIDPAFAPGWDPRAEVLAARAAERE